MTVEVRFPGGRWRWLALASPVLGFVALSCRIGYEQVPQGALSDGGATGGSAAAPAGGFAGDVAAGAGTASGASGGSAGDASAGSASGGVVGDAGASSGGDAGLMGGAGAGAGASGAGAGAGGRSGAGGSGAGGRSGAGGSGAGAGGSAGSLGAGGSSGGCGEPANCVCQSFGGHVYWFCSTPTARDAAQAICAGGGLDLARIDDGGENAWVFGIALALNVLSPTGTPTDLVFTGANDSVTLDDWQWQDGTLFWSGGAPVDGRYSNWASSNPQSSSARRCAGIFFTGEWQSRSCTALQPFVCEGS